jgi:hypothetical protein
MEGAGRVHYLAGFSFSFFFNNFILPGCGTPPGTRTS